MAEGSSDTDIQWFGSILSITGQLMLRAAEYLEPIGVTSRPWLLPAMLDKRFPGSAPSIAEATAVRSHRATAAARVLAAVPFAVATAWSVVTPLTAVLMLAVGLPYVLGHPHPVSSAGGTS